MDNILNKSLNNKSEVINIQNTTFYYKEQDNQDNQEDLENQKQQIILDNINLSVNKGEFVAIIGHNGSGKSTLAKHINALLLPNIGDVCVFGMNTKDDENTFKIRQRAGMVFQNPDNQMVTSIVEEDVAFGPENLGVPSDEIKTRVHDALVAVNMLKFAKHAPDQLSGGQKQRIAIAGVLAMQGDIIVFDEPTAMLDPAGRKEVLQTILKLNKQNKITIVLITHFMEEAALADKIIILNKGSIALEGSPKQIFEQKNIAKIKNFGLEVPFVVGLMQNLHEKNINLNLENNLDEDALVAELNKLII